MIPRNDNQETSIKSVKEKIGSFSFFDLEYFLRKVIKNWYWFLLMFIIGYVISFFYSKYYAQRIYQSNLSLSISNNTASYFTPNQSINFIWGQSGNQDGVFLKKMLLSRTHNEYLVKQLDLFVNYTTKGLVKATYLDKYDSPVILEIDKNHLQQTNFPITIIPKGKDRYEVILPEKGYSNHLYNYKTESVETIKPYSKPTNKVIGLEEWYTSPNLRFKLVKNPDPSSIKFNNIIVTLVTVNQKVNEIISNIDISFDKEISSIMIISKRGYNLNGTVNFLNASVEELKVKRLRDRNQVDQNTVQYINENLLRIKKKLDSAGEKLNNLKIVERLYDVKGKDQQILTQLINLEKKRDELISNINSLNAVRNSVLSNRLDEIISLNMAGVDDGAFSASISELKSLYAKRRELASIYTPTSAPMKEINHLINEAKGSSENSLKKYYSIYYDQLNHLNQQINDANSSLVGLPEQQRKYFDVERGYNIIEHAYNTLLTKQAETQMRVETNRSDINIIDPAKNLGQEPIAPNIRHIKYTIIGGLMVIPLLFLIIGEVLDDRVRNINEIISTTKIPLLGIIGKNSHENNLSVIEQPNSSISEAFRSIRANLRFLYNEDGKSKVILVTSSIGGEGKTYTSINIASVLGLSGKKTILLGMDLRKPKIFYDFRIDNKYGISNYLTGEVTLERIINKTEVPDLFVASSGPIPPNPSELLMSDKNINFIKGLRKEYDFIIIDSPPAGLVADSFELMKHTDTNIYVIRHEYTEKYMLKMITEKYHNHEVKHLGIVYNDYVANQGYGYGYGYGYFDEDKNYEEPFLIKARNRIRRLFSKNI